MKRTKVIQAVAVPVTPSSADSAEYRKQLAERYGFRQIGEPLLDNVTLKDVLDTLPKKVYFLMASCLFISFSLNVVQSIMFCHFGLTAERTFRPYVHLYKQDCVTS